MKAISAIRYPLRIDDGLGAMAVERNYGEHIEQMIKQVLLTRSGDRVCRPDFGCGLRQALFNANSEVTASLAKVTVQQALEHWLGTVIELEKVDVEARNEQLQIAVSYRLRSNPEIRMLNLTVGV